MQSLLSIATAVSKTHRAHNSSAPIPLCKLLFSAQIKGCSGLETHSLLYATELCLLLKGPSQKHSITRTSLALIFYPNSLFLGRNIRVPWVSIGLSPGGTSLVWAPCLWSLTVSPTLPCNPPTSQDQGQNSILPQ